MKNISISVALFTALLLTTSTALAETRYIADQLVVTVRSSTGKNYQILEKLRTDTPVTVLKDDGSFIQVKTKKGNTGYIRSEYVSKNLPKPIRIAELKKQVEKLEQQLEKERLACLDNTELASSGQAKIDAISKDLLLTKQELEKVSSDYKTLLGSSKDVLDLMTAYEDQSEENSRLSSELAVLQYENKNFHRSNMIQWFLAGGAVFFFGWLAGKISRRKRGFSRL